MAISPEEAGCITALIALETALEQLPRDVAHEPQRQALERTFYEAIFDLSIDSARAWRARCLADADRPGRWRPRPPLDVRHAACLGFGCADCDHGIDDDLREAAFKADKTRVRFRRFKVH